MSLRDVVIEHFDVYGSVHTQCVVVRRRKLPHVDVWRRQNASTYGAVHSVNQALDRC